jgi:hypothetical protein
MSGAGDVAAREPGIWPSVNIAPANSAAAESRNPLLIFPAAVGRSLAKFSANRRW